MGTWNESGSPSFRLICVLGNFKLWELVLDKSAKCILVAVGRNKQNLSDSDQLTVRMIRMNFLHSLTEALRHWHLLSLLLELPVVIAWVI